MTQDAKVLAEASEHVEIVNHMAALPSSTWQGTLSPSLPSTAFLQDAEVATGLWASTRPLALALALLLATLGLAASLYAIADARWRDRLPLEAIRTTLGHLSPVQVLLVGSVGGVALVVVGIGLLLGLAFYIVNELIRPQRSTHFIPVTPFALGLPAEDVHFPALGGSHDVTGLFIPQPGATTTILVSPGYRRSYRDVLGMCRHLWQAGHNILVFEYYGHSGTSARVPVTLGYREINDFLGAVAYAKQRAPGTRLGALGYSMGGAVSIIGSARAKDVQAVVADSAFATHWNAVEVAVHRTLRVSRHWPRFLLRLLHGLTNQVLWLRAGYRFEHVEPVREIAKLAPRSVLLIHGLDDTIVDPRDGKRLYQAAGRPKAIWLLPKTEHIKGYFTDSKAYVARVINFFDAKLKNVPLTKQTEEHHVASSPGQEHQETGEPVPVSLSERRRESRARAAVAQVATHAKHERRPSAKGLEALGLAYGRFIYRSRWWVLGAWLLLILASAPFARIVPTVLHNNGYSISSSESAQVDSLLVSKLHRPATEVIAVFQSDRVPVADPTYQNELNAFTNRVKSFAHVTEVAQGGTGKDGRSTFLAIGFDADKDAVAERIPDLRRLLPQTGPARSRLTGDSAIANEIQMDTQSDTEHAELIAMPLTLLVLLIVFGTLVAGAIPLLLAGVVVPTALAAVYLVALHLQTNIFVQSIVSIIGLGLAIDYSLFVIRRFREELARGVTVQDAIATTIATAGEAILFSGLTVVIGFAGLLFIGINVMTSFGVGGIAVAGVAVLAALTLLPALLSVIGLRINALRVPVPRGLFARSGKQGKGAARKAGFWQRWAVLVMRKPVLIIALVSMVLVLFGWPALRLNPGDPGVEALPSGSQARLGLDILHAQFPAVNDDPIFLLVRTPDGSPIMSPQNLQRVHTLTQRLGRQANISAVQSLTDLPPSPGTPALTLEQLTRLYTTGSYQQNPVLKAFVAQTTSADTTLITLRASTRAGTSDDQALIDRLRALDPQSKQGLITLVGGARVVNLDFDRALYEHFFQALLFIVLATYLVLLAVFRSVLLPLKAILMNILSIGASYGALVVVFQDGHLQNLLNFTASGYIDRFIPTLLCCVVFGLSMDYEVFLLMRVRESWLKTGDNRAAVAIGLEKTGGVITHAALLFVIVTSSFMLTQLVVTKELGLGITVAVLIDASIIRCMLVPAAMQVMGRWNWWFPGRPLPQRTVVTLETSSSIEGTAQESLSLAPTLSTASQGKQQKLLPTPTGEVTEARLLPPLTPASNRQDARHQAHIELQLIRIWAKILALPIEQVRGNSDFFLCGGDSDSLSALIDEIKQQFSVNLAPDDVFDRPVLFRLATVLVEKQYQAQDVRQETYLTRDLSIIKGERS